MESILLMIQQSMPSNQGATKSGVDRRQPCVIYLSLPSYWHSQTVNSFKRSKVEHQKLNTFKLITFNLSIDHPIPVIGFYYSTNSRDAHIWSESHCYPSSVHNRYPAIYVGCNILVNLAEYCLILANSTYGLVG